MRSRVIAIYATAGKDHRLTLANDFMRECVTLRSVEQWGAGNTRAGVDAPSNAERELLDGNSNGLPIVIHSEDSSLSVWSKESDDGQCRRAVRLEPAVGRGTDREHQTAKQRMNSLGEHKQVPPSAPSIPATLS